MRGRLPAAASVVLAVAVLAAACSSSDGGAAPSGSASPIPSAEPTPPVPSPDDAASATVRWAVGDVEHVVPGDATSRDELLVVAALFEPLTRLDSAGRARSALAESWDVREDGQRWRFTLDPDARFVAESADATRSVTADDVVFAWERAVADGRAGFLLRDVAGYDALAEGEASRLDGVTAVDEVTVDVELTHPHTAFDVVVSHPSLAPLPRDRWRDDAAGERQRPVGNGPFRMAEAVVSGRYLRLQPVEDWHRGAPDVDELLLQTMGVDSAYVAFQQGRLDVAPVPEDAVDRARQEYGSARPGGLGGGLMDEPNGDLLALGVNVRAEPLDDPEVRRALSHAIDRAALARTDAPGAATPASSLLSPALPEGGRDRCAHCRHDPATAAAIFGAHGVDELTVWVDEDGRHGALTARLRRDLAAAGVSLHVEQRPFGEWVRAVEAGEAPLFRLGWAPEHRTGLNVLEPLVHSDGVWNHTGLADEELDALITQAAMAPSRTEREAALREAEAVALESAAVIPLAYGEHRTVVDDRLSGLRIDALGRVDVSRLAVQAVDRQGGEP